MSDDLFLNQYEPNPDTNGNSLETRVTPPPTYQSLRQQIANAAQQSRKRKRKTRNSQASTLDQASPGDSQQISKPIYDQYQQNVRALARAAKWNAFLYASHVGHAALIENVFGALNRDSIEFATHRKDVMDKVKNGKTATLVSTEAFVDKELTENRVLQRAKERDDIYDEFEEIYSPENFIACWSWMQNYLDAAKTGAKGQWFMKTIFACLCVEMTIYIRVCDKIARPTPTADDLRPKRIVDRNAREVLLAAYDAMFMKQEFIDAKISKRHFKEIFDHARGEKVAKKTADTSVLTRMRVKAAPASDSEDRDDEDEQAEDELLSM